MLARRTSLGPRTLALAVALSVTGSGLLAGPAQATSTSASSVASTQDGSTTFDTNAPAPRAADPADQNALEKAWEKIGNLVFGDKTNPDEKKSGDGEDTPKAAVLPPGSDNVALTAEGFVNSVGVGTHVAYLDTTYGDVDAVKLVQDLGVLHVRDGLGSSDSVPIQTMQRLGKAGVDINWVAQPEDSTFSIESQLKVITENDLPVTSVEGANERDNHGDVNWVGKVRTHQGELYGAVKERLGADVAVVAPSLVHDGSRAELGQVPSDVGNSHPYTGGEMQTQSQTEHQLEMSKEVTSAVDTSAPRSGRRVDLKSAVKNAGAMWATETGFHTATDSTAGSGVQPYVSEDAQAVLQLQQVLANYSNGVDRSYIYELMDEGDDNSQAEDRFGLAHPDGSPKPAFTALKNLLAIVKRGGPSTDGGAAPVDVRVSGANDVTTSLVLPRADGSTVVAVWQASPVWDPGTEQPLDVAERQVTLNMGSHVDAEVFVPGHQAKAVSTQSDTDSVEVTSAATPTIVVLAPTGDEVPATPKPTATPTPMATPTATVTPTATARPTMPVKTGSGGNPFESAGPYADPTYAADEAAKLRGSDPTAAAALDRITRGGVSLWVGDWNGTKTVAETVRSYVRAAATAGQTPVITTYAIPGRDCQGFSAGGLNPAQYGTWVQAVADGLRGSGAAVVVEPDAIAQLGECDGQGDRLALLRGAVQAFTSAGAAVYLDAGNSSWTGGQVDMMASRLREAGVEEARGFATNVSNFNTDADEKVYAEALSKATGGARYVIDTSRNGNGPGDTWCNPLGRRLGAIPGVVDDGSHQDANLWIKRAGESDGTCNGGPAAGQFWTDYAVGLGS